jgi:hypothetical protein
LGTGGHDIFLMRSDGQENILELNNANQVTTAANVSVIGTGTNLFGTGGQTIFYETSANQLAAVEFNSAHQMVAGGIVTHADGSAVGLPPGANSVLGTGQNIFGTGGHDIFLMRSDGQENILELNNANQVTTSANVSVIGTGTSLFGTGGQTIFYETSANQLATVEFNSAHQMVAGGLVTHSDGSAVGLPPGTNGVLGTGQNFFGAGGHDIFVMRSDGQELILEVNNTNQVIFSSNVSVIGNGPSLFGTDSQTIFYETAAGQLATVEFNAANQMVAGGLVSGGSAANSEINFTATTISKESLWLTQSGNDLLVRILGTNWTVTVTGWFGSNAGSTTLAITTADGLELTPARAATIVTAMAAYQTAHSSFNPATATAMPTDTTLQNAITAAWNKYDTITTNGDGSWVGTLNDHIGANWQFIRDSYTASNQLSSSVEKFNDNSTIETDYNLSGTGGWTKGVHFTNGAGQDTEDDLYYTDGSHDAYTYGPSPIQSTDSFYNASNVLLSTFQRNTDGSSIQTNYNPTGVDGWTKGVHFTNAAGQDTEDDVYYVDNTYDKTVWNHSGGTLVSTDSYYSASNVLINTTEMFTDGSEISIDYDNNNEGWLTGTRSFDASHNLLLTDVLYPSNGHWFYANTFNTTMNGGTGYNGYEFTGSSFGTDTIHNGGGTTAHGEVDFDSTSITDEKLWFKKVGNDLTVQKLASSNTITIAGWYTSGQAGNQVQSFHANGLTIDSQVATLVNAMATYQTAHSSFNPNTATSMPTDTTLQNAIAAAWHS